MRVGWSLEEEGAGEDGEQTRGGEEGRRRGVLLTAGKPRRRTAHRAWSSMEAVAGGRWGRQSGPDSTEREQEACRSESHSRAPVLAWIWGAGRCGRRRARHDRADGRGRTPLGQNARQRAKHARAHARTRTRKENAEHTRTQRERNENAGGKSRAGSSGGVERRRQEDKTRLSGLRCGWRGRADKRSGGFGGGVRCRRRGGRRSPTRACRMV